MTVKSSSVKAEMKPNIVSNIDEKAIPNMLPEVLDTLPGLFACIGRKLAARRCAKELSQAQLGRMAGVSPSYISKIECGHNLSGITIQILWAVATSLEFKFTELFNISVNDVKRLRYYRHAHYSRRIGHHQ